MRRIAVLMVVTAAALAACGDDDSSTPPTTASESTGAGDSAEVSLQSPAFANGAGIPETYSRGGGNLSPPLDWSVTAGDVAELALVMWDRDAEFNHWLVAGIDPASTGTGEGATPPGAVEGRNDFGDVGYGGPDPPGGERHRYVFTLYALERESGLAEGFSLDDFNALLEGEVRVLATADYAGFFSSGV